MKILQLKSENILNLKAIDITPSGSAVVLTGKNGAGKSAVLDSIFFALTGKKVDELIRTGEDRAEVFVDLGDYKVKKVWTAKGERLEVMSKDGALYPKPQTMLNKIIGDLSFDPLAFKTMKDKDQRDLLAKIVGLDFAPLQAKRDGLYTDRTIAGREMDKWKASLANQPKPDAALPDKEVSITDQMAVIEGLEAKRRAHSDYLEATEEITSEINHNLGEMANIEDEILRLQKRLDSLEAANTQLELKQGSLEKPEIVTDNAIAAARSEIGRIEAVNKAVRDAHRYRQAEAEYRKAKQVYDDLTKAIDACDQEKAEKTKAAAYPIPELGITDTSVIYTGIPFKQLSTGQAIKVSTAIAMALNPGLKIIMIRDASLLDEAGMQAITELAKKKDYQLWIEKVDETGKVGIFIENGEIKGA